MELKELYNDHRYPEDGYICLDSRGELPVE